MAFLAVWGVICLFRRMIEPKIGGTRQGCTPALPAGHLRGHEAGGAWWR